MLLAPSDDLGYDDGGDEELSSGVPASGRVARYPNLLFSWFLNPNLPNLSLKEPRKENTKSPNQNRTKEFGARSMENAGIRHQIDAERSCAHTLENELFL